MRLKVLARTSKKPPTPNKKRTHHMTKEEWYRQLFEHLSASKFRSSFHLKQKDIVYIKEKGLDEGEVKAAIIGSVVPNIMHSLSSGLIKYFDVKPIIVGPGIKTGINLGRFNPREVGADRIVDLVAGYEIYGGPALVIDYGTATTYDIVTENGVFLKFPLTEIPQKKKNAVGVRGIKLVKDDTVDDVYLIGNTEDVSTEYCGKTIDLGRMKLAHRDTNGTKVRV